MSHRWCGFSCEIYLSTQNRTINIFLEKHKHANAWTHTQTQLTGSVEACLAHRQLPSLPTPTLERLSDKQWCTVWIMKTYTVIIRKRFFILGWQLLKRFDEEEVARYLVLHFSIKLHFQSELIVPQVTVLPQPDYCNSVCQFHSHYNAESNLSR